MQVVTNATNVFDGMRTVFAPIGCTTPGTGLDIEKVTLRGVESFGMLCAAKDAGWVEDETQGAIVLPSSFVPGSSVPTEAPMHEVEHGGDDAKLKGKKKKKKKGGDELEKMLQEQAADAVQEPLVFEGKKKKKKAMDEKDLLAALEQTSENAENEVAAAPTMVEDSNDKNKVSEDQEPASKKKKKKKAKAQRTQQEEEEIEAILAMLEGPKEEEEEPAMDLDAVRKAAEAAQGKAATTTADAPLSLNKPLMAEAEETEEPQHAERQEEEKRELTAAQKKKLKKKEKEKAKKEAAKEESAAPKKPKPVNAAIRKMQEALEEKKRLEEEAQRKEEERLRKEAEEEERLREEERKAEEERQRKKEQKKAKREQMRKDGKLLTAKQREEQRRLAMVREQMLQAAGVSDVQELVEGQQEERKKEKVVYTKKKKKAPTPQEDIVKKEVVEEPISAEKGVTLPIHKVESPDEKPVEETVPTEVEDQEALTVDAPDDWEEKNWEEEHDEEGDLNGKTVYPSQLEERDLEDTKEASSVSSYSSDSDYYDSSEDEAERTMRERKEKAKALRQERLEKALAERDANNLRSPICCILGHVDTGKTKLLDKIRGTNVQDGEAGGITQQIGATYIPKQAIVERTVDLNEGEMDLKLPGLLVIDTPGHESFTNLRSRGSGLCDIAILVVDIMHGLEQQTLESLNLLRMRKTPFIIALNKVDRMFEWKSHPNAPIQKALEGQQDYVISEYEQRFDKTVLAFQEQGLNVAPYWKNPDVRKYVNIVPTSAISGEGLPDILQLLCKLTQEKLRDRLMYVEDTQCTVLEVKMIEGLGTTIDVILVNGTLREGDTIVVCGLQGPIVTQIRALLTPHPMRELRVKGSYIHHKEIKAAQGVKITANGLETAIAGTQLFAVGPDDDLEELKDEAMADMSHILGSVDKSGEGVCVQASTLGSLEALLEFLKSPAVQIPVSGINIGPIHKKDVMRASVMLERKRKEFAVILAFDVKVEKDAVAMAEELGVKIFTADIIYHLFDQFVTYMAKVKEEKRKAAEFDAVFPCILKILPNCVFNKKDPIILGCEVLEGIAKVGTPLCVPNRPDPVDGGFLTIGRISSIENNHKSVPIARKGDSVAVKINSTNPTEATRMVGRHFFEDDELVSLISRRSIDLLKENYRNDLNKEEWILVVKLKKLFDIL